MKTGKFPIQAGAVVTAVLAAAMIPAGCDGAQQYPKSIEVSARPGAALVVPFDQRVKGAPKRAMSWVPASPLIDPNPLPHGAELLHSRLALFGSGDVSGDILIYVPETASGDIAFSLAASGDGRGQSASVVFFKTETTDVTVKVEGTPIENTAPPDLTGAWMYDDKIWTFEVAPTPTLRILYATGEEKVMRYEPWPDGAGGWFLVDVFPSGMTYWVRLDGDALLIAHPDAQFEPFATLERQ